MVADLSKPMNEWGPEEDAEYFLALEAYRKGLLQEQLDMNEDHEECAETSDLDEDDEDWDNDWNDPDEFEDVNPDESGAIWAEENEVPPEDQLGDYEAMEEEGLFDED